MKIILNVRGYADMGKTTTIKTAYQKLSGKTVEGEILTEPPITVQGKLVGFVSYGDTDENRALIQLLVDLKCDIIVCASRTKGASSNAVLEIARDNDYQVVTMSPFTYVGWPSTEEIRKSLIDIFTEINSNAILKFIEEAVKL